MWECLKSNYSKECQRYLAANPGRVITTEIIASILGKAWPVSFTPVNIMAGFRKSGAFPLNPGEVTDRHLAPSKGVYVKEPSPQLPTGSTSANVTTSPPASSDSSLRSPRSFTSDQQREQKRKEQEQKKKDKREQKHSVPAKRKSSKSENRGLSTSTPDLASIFSDKCHYLDSSDAECPECGLTFLEDESGKPWVCCDRCESWLDFKCTGLTNSKRVPKKFYCHSCM